MVLVNIGSDCWAKCDLAVKFHNVDKLTHTNQQTFKQTNKNSRYFYFQAMDKKHL